MLFAYGNMIRYYPTLVNLTSFFFVLCTNVKVYLYNYLKWVEPSIEIFMQERVKEGRALQSKTLFVYSNKV